MDPTGRGYPALERGVGPPTYKALFWRTLASNPTLDVKPAQLAIESCRHLLGLPGLTQAVLNTLLTKRQYQLAPRLPGGFIPRDRFLLQQGVV